MSDERHCDREPRRAAAPVADGLGVGRARRRSRTFTRITSLRVLALLAGLIAASSTSAAGPTAAVDATTAAAREAGAPSASDIVRVPAGADWRAPAGADMTEGLSELLDAPPPRDAAAQRPSEWVAVPIPFNNPLLGAGLVGGVARLYKPAEQPDQPRASMYGAGGMYATNGSWALAAADRRYWADSRIRTTLAAGTGEVRYDLGLNGSDQGRSAPVDQVFRGAVLDVAYHLRDRLWVGGGLKFARVDTSTPGLELNASDPSLFPGEYQVGMFNVKTEWDSRSDEFYPTDGALAHADINVSTTGLGSDSNYAKYQVYYNRYRAIDERSTLAWRVAAQTVSGDPPFFALPWYGSGVDLRGYTPGVYVGRSLFAAQAEWRWQATRKLGLVAFAGAGGVYGKVPAFKQDDWLPAGGLGLRWRVADKYRVNFRVDYAWAKGDETLIVSVGEAF